VPQASVDLVGSAGAMHLDLPFVNKVDVTSHVRIRRPAEDRPIGTFGDDSSRFEEETLAFENVNAYRDEFEAMVACVLVGAGPVVPLADSRGNVATLEALCTSAREGRSVFL
jgi:predicted dehydrogenase